VVITAYADRSFTFVTKTPPNTYFLKKAAGITKGSPTVGKGPSMGRVTTTQLRAGYVRKNGAPYSANAVLEEYFDSFKEDNGDTWLVVTAIVTDPQYLYQPFITSSHFKKLPDATGWNPTPCEEK